MQREEWGMHVSRKVVLVMGGAGGLGAACARRLVGEGSIVFVSDIQSTPADLLEGTAIMQHDVSVADDWQRVVEDIVGRHGRLDVLVHCAGIEATAAGTAWRRPKMTGTGSSR